ncbi:MAG: response regulator transcription factor [Bacteroidales bacterium]|nr:response regulator transcription factor [Bacteroidales bacterium]
MLVDDHKLFREGIRFVINQMDNINVVDEASNGKELLEILETKKTDLILMDISMPEIDGVEATRIVTQKYPTIKILALSMFCDQEYYFKMINAGVMGFVLKESGKDELEEAIRTILNGENYFSQKLLRDIIMNINQPIKKDKPRYEEEISFTKREVEVLNYICQGMSNSEIADKLFLSIRTVEGHKSNLISKTGVKNTINLVMYALKNHLVEI